MSNEVNKSIDKTGMDENDGLRKYQGTIEKLFYFFLAWELIYEVLRTTPFPKYAENFLGRLFAGGAAGQLHSILFGINSLRLLILIPALYTIFVEMKKVRERVVAVGLILIGFFYSARMLAWNDNTVLTLMLLLVASYGRDFRRIAQYSIGIVTVLYMATAVICIFGLIPEYNLERDGRIRHSLGFSGITATASYMCFVLLLGMFLNSGILKWYNYLFIAFVCGFNIWLIDGRIALVSVLTATAGATVCTICNKKGRSLPEGLEKALRALFLVSHLVIGGGY